MRISMKDTFFKDRLQHQPDQGVDRMRHRFRVQLPVNIHPFAGRELQGKHGSARTRRNDIWNPEVRDVCQRGAEEHDRTRFATEIELPVQTLIKFTYRSW